MLGSGGLVGSGGSGCSGGTGGCWGWFGWFGCVIGEKKAQAMPRVGSKMAADLCKRFSTPTVLAAALQFSEPEITHCPAVPGGAWNWKNPR